jgi:hypothetical protein
MIDAVLLIIIINSAKIYKLFDIGHLLHPFKQ